MFNLDTNDQDDLTLITIWILFCILSWCWGFGCVWCSKKCYKSYKSRCSPNGDTQTNYAHKHIDADTSDEEEDGYAGGTTNGDTHR